MSLIERLRAKRYVRERWVEPVGTMDEPCDADDEGAQEILRNPDGPEAAEAISSLLKRVGELEGERDALLTADHRSVMANVRLGRWLSAALDDPAVCEEMKADVHEWFSAGHPPHALQTALNSEAAAVGGR